MTKSHVHASLKEAIEYVAHGEHAFIASDQPRERDMVVEHTCSALSDHPIRVVNAGDTASNAEFANRVFTSCQELLGAIDSSLSSVPRSLFELLSQTMTGFREENRKGFLIVNHIDTVIARQTGMEVEAPFREIMQFNNDIVIVWLGSRESILTINGYDRPFYLSHRCFGL